MITPMDIENKEFKKGFRGYNEEEVDEFLDIVKEDFENLYTINCLKHSGMPLKKIKEFMDNAVETATETGYATTILNRRRYIPEIKASNFIVRNQGKRFAMNAPIQGSAADIIKVAMVNVYNKLKENEMKSKLILQVHDELIVEAVDEELELAEKIVREEMENAQSMDVKLDVDLNTGNSWYETK